MTTYEDNLLASRFAALAPEPLPGDWAGVLERVEVGGGSVRRTPRAWFAVGGVATAAAVTALVLFWPAAGGGDGIIDKARAAVESGGGPVVHVVLELQPVEVYDLERDEYGSVPVVLEQWFEPHYGFQERSTVGTQPREDIEVPTQYAGVATAYRRALETDKASLGPEETVQGRRVYWIRFTVDGPFGETREEEVAVDAETFEPRFVRLRGRAEGNGLATVRTFETIPLAEHEFGPRPGSPPPPPAAWNPDAGWSAPGRPGLLSPAEARAALEGALWLGEQFHGLRLASIREFTRETGVPKGILPQSVRALELCYGPAASCAVSVTLATIAHALAAQGHPWPYEPPTGTLALGEEPGVGFTIRDGVYVTLVARDREELIAAAKALGPIP